MTQILNLVKKTTKFEKKIFIEFWPMEETKMTRWNLNYIMLKSIIDNWFTITEIFSESKSIIY